MHFRQYVLKSILIGAALFFPTNAYAEKADHTSKLPIKTEKAAVQKKTAGNQVKKANSLKKVQKPKRLDKPELQKINRQNFRKEKGIARTSQS